MTSEPQVLNGADPVFKTEGGVILNLGPPQMAIQFDDPIEPILRERAVKEIAEGTFELNGIKRYWAGFDGTQGVVCGWAG